MGEIMKKIKYYELLNKNVNLINIDDRYEYSLSHLKGSINIPYDDLIANYRNLLSKDKKYYIYCKGGIKSRRAVTILEYLGYDVVMVEK